MANLSRDRHDFGNLLSSTLERRKTPGSTTKLFRSCSWALTQPVGRVPGLLTNPHPRELHQDATHQPGPLEAEYTRLPVHAWHIEARIRLGSAIVATSPRAARL